MGMNQSLAHVEAVGHDTSSLRQRIGDYFAALFGGVLFLFKTSYLIIINRLFNLQLLELNERCIYYARPCSSSSSSCCCNYYFFFFNFQYIVKV